MLSVFEDFGRVLAFGMAEDAVAVVEVAVQLHVAERDEAIEPGVGHRLHDLVEALALDALLQSPALMRYDLWICPAAHDDHVARLLHLLRALGRKAEERRPIRDGPDEVEPGSRGVGVKGGAVHAG